MSQNSGKSLVALGLADSLIKRADRVGFFRPVFDGATIADDPMARLIREHFGLTEEQVGGAVSMTDALALIAEGDTEEISARRNRRRRLPARQRALSRIRPERPNRT